MPWLEFFTGKKQGKVEEVSPEAAALAVSVGIGEEVPPPGSVHVEYSTLSAEWTIRMNRLSEKVYLQLKCERCATEMNFDGPPSPENRAMLNKTKCAHTAEIPDGTWAEYAARYAGPLTMMDSAYYAASFSQRKPDPRQTPQPLYKDF